MERTIRLADVAKAAGVSQGTASNVFSRPQLVRQEVRERVTAMAKSMGYHGPNLRGRLLRAGKVNAIGVAAAEPLSYFFDDPFARVLLTGISEACDANGAGIALVSAINEEKLAWNVDTALVDGLILLCLARGKRLIELTRERRLPFVALELGNDDDSLSAVGIDNFAAAKLAGQHIAGLGHRYAAILSFPGVDGQQGRVELGNVESAQYANVRDRIFGYVAGLSEAGIGQAAVPIYVSNAKQASVDAAMQMMFAVLPRPTAILAMSDRMALMALAWLRARGTAVPGEVSIVGFDGIPAGATANPALTTIAQPIAEIGRRAVDMILNDDGMARRVLLDVELTVRASTARPPKLK